MHRPIIIALSLFLFITIASASAGVAAPRSWEDLLNDTAAARGAAAAAAANGATPASKKKSSSTAPAVSVALASAWATVTWNADKGQYECEITYQYGDAAGFSAYCEVYGGDMLAVFVDCPKATSSLASVPSCFYPVIGDSPSVVKGWFVRGTTLGCGFTPPMPAQLEPFKIGASAYCMTVRDVPVPSRHSSHGL